MAYLNSSNYPRRYAVRTESAVSGLIYDQSRPTTTSGATILNPEVRSKNSAAGFDRHASGKYFQSGLDERDYDPLRNVKNMYEAPPKSGEILGDARYTDPRTKQYHAGKYYSDHQNINAGDVMYHVQHPVKDPFHSPVHVQPDRTVAYHFTDPMSVHKPQFELIQDPVPNRITTFQHRDTYPNTFIRDTTYHRDDLISRQSRVRNQQRYSNLHGH